MRSGSAGRRPARAVGIWPPALRAGAGRSTWIEWKDGGAKRARQRFSLACSADLQVRLSGVSRLNQYRALTETAEATVITRRRSATEAQRSVESSRRSVLL